jgi:pimeloyl-ACP methyl ester carboxylesterase
MPLLQRPDGEINYLTFGEGFPVLLFAPGGLRSAMGFWRSPTDGPPRPWVDWTQALPAAGFTAIAMDQRNAGKSKAEIKADHGWHTYAADHLALMDHLGFERFHVLGGCIGGSFCMMATKTAPDRVAAQVLQNPIGLNSEHPDFFQTMHADWSREIREARPQVSEADLAGFGRTCGAATSCSAPTGRSCAAARRHRSCCRARTRRTRPRPAPSLPNCCRTSRCWPTGAGRSTWPSKNGALWAS